MLFHYHCASLLSFQMILLFSLHYYKNEPSTLFAKFLPLTLDKASAHLLYFFLSIETFQVTSSTLFKREKSLFSPIDEEGERNATF
jgi:hypothetical protein